jgi:hypothetical protein
MKPRRKSCIPKNDATITAPLRRSPRARQVLAGALVAEQQHLCDAVDPGLERAGRSALISWYSLPSRNPARASGLYWESRATASASRLHLLQRRTLPLLHLADQPPRPRPVLLHHGHGQCVLDGEWKYSAPFVATPLPGHPQAVPSHTRAVEHVPGREQQRLPRAVRAIPSYPPATDLSIVDEHTRECLGGLVDRSVTGEDLIDELDRIAAVRGYPAVLRCDNGPELACAAMADWAL